MSVRRWSRTARRLAGPALAGPVSVAMAVDYIVDDDDPLADFQGVQAAVHASWSLDTVRVRCGLYVENVVIQGDADAVPDVIGEDPSCTILDV